MLTFLSSKIRDLTWEDFHTILQPEDMGEDKDLGPALTGKIISLQMFSANVVHASLKAAWSQVKEFSLVEFEPNIFLFRFPNEDDEAFVLNHTPWNIRGHLLALIPWNPKLTIPEISFHFVGYVGATHGLPWNRVD